MHDVEGGTQTLEETNASRHTRHHSVAPHLFLVLECARIEAGGTRHDLSHIDEVSIGRGAKRMATRSLAGSVGVLDLRVPDARMSQNHARIRKVGCHFALEDLGSLNGSRVGGIPVVAPVTLRDGELLELGRTFFRFRAALATPLGTPADIDSASRSEGAPPGFATLLPDLLDKHSALAKVAPSRVPVLLLGQTGTGKEVLARAIHQASGRTGPFVAVNCGAIPPALVEAQLFGHVRGAFSGAVRDAAGFVRTSHLGTLFLDEIADLPKAAQAALLRVLQEREVVAVGSARPDKVDMRVLSATHENLTEQVARGVFREDLLARLTGMQYELPPLRDRIEDLGLLAASIFSHIAPDRATVHTLTPSAARGMLAHHWPSNVRELELRLSLGAALAGDAPIDFEHLMANADAEKATKIVRKTAETSDDRALRARLIEELQRAGGNVASVARAMGKARMQIQRWTKRFNVDPKSFRAR